MNRIYEEILKCVMACKNEKLLKILYEEDDDEKDSKLSGNNDKALVFLSTKNVNDFLNYKQTIFKKLITTKFDFKLLHSHGEIKI